MSEHGKHGKAAGSAQEVARRSAAAMRAEDVTARWLGIGIEDVAPGRATARMRVGAAMVNGHAIAHGGFVFLLADTAFAFACNTYGKVTVAREASISFLAPARAGDELVAVAVERHRRGRNGIYDVTVRRGGGKVGDTAAGEVAAAVEAEVAGEVVAEFRGHSRALGRPLGDVST